MYIFYQISNYYLNISCSQANLPPCFISKQEVSNLKHKRILSCEEALRIISTNDQLVSNFKVAKGNRYIAFIPWNFYKLEFFIWKNIELEIMARIEKFRANQKEILLN